MAYEFNYISSNLILVTWVRYPTRDEEKQFLKDHTEQLESATEPIYYISDLRLGRIVTMNIVNQMSQLAKHPNYGGSTAFSEDLISKIVVQSFQTFSQEALNKSLMVDTVEEALAFLETLKAGITQGIDWDDYIKPI